MNIRLNFICFVVILILPFVSFWNAANAASSTSAQEKDEFAIFDDDSTPAAPAKPAQKAAPAKAASTSTPPKTAAPLTNSVPVNPVATQGASAVNLATGKSSLAPADAPAVAAKSSVPANTASAGSTKPATTVGASVVNSSSTTPSLVKPGAVATISKETSAQKIERLKNEIHQNPKNVNLIVQLAEEFYKTGEYDKSTALLWKQVDKLDHFGLMLLARSHEKKKEPNEMIHVGNILVGKNENDAEALTLLGNAYTMQKKSKEALDNYKKALDANGKYEPAYQGLVQLYEKRDPPNLYELRILFQDMIEKLGNRAEFQAKLCEINTKDGTYEPAIEACKEALSKNPHLPEAMVYLGLSLKEYSESDQQAIKTLKKAADEFPKSELAQYTYGKYLQDQKNSVDAMKYFKIATDADPTSARAWLGLAGTTFDLKKYEIALISYRNACKYDRKNAAAFRKATTALKNTHSSDWVSKFEAASENCGL